MNREKILKERRELLEEMCQELNDELFAAMMKEPETEDEPPLLRLMLDNMGYGGAEQALGEFFFLPLPAGEVGIQHFMAMITIADDLENAKFPELFEVMSYVNASLPCGSYSLGKDKKFLTFNITVPLSLDLSREDLYKEMDATVGNAIALVDIHMDMLLKVMEGTMTVEDAKDLIN